MMIQKEILNLTQSLFINFIETDKDPQNTS